MGRYTVRPNGKKTGGWRAKKKQIMFISDNWCRFLVIRLLLVVYFLLLVGLFPGVVRLWVKKKTPTGTAGRWETCFLLPNRAVLGTLFGSICFEQHVVHNCKASCE